MAKISIEFDTVAKTMSATIDGKAVDNVISASLYKSMYSDDENEFRCSLVTMTKDKADDICTYTQVSASESNDAVGKPSPTFAGFVEKVIELMSKAQAHVHNYFCRD